MTAPVDLGRVNRWRGRVVLLVVCALTVALAVGSGVYTARRLLSWEDLPDPARLGSHKPSVITKILADDGRTLIGEYAQERRIVLTYDQIPPRLIDGIIAVEDADFFKHVGINVRGIVRAAWSNFKAGRTVEGGSSLTQQLAKLMFLDPARNYTRKLKEAVLALQIERMFSKEEILTLYCNEIYLGHKRYGVEAAARYYFGRPAIELELAEVALLAGLPQAPEGLSPIRHPEAAHARRDHVLDRMVAEAMISQEEADEAKRQPLEIVTHRAAKIDDTGMYFVEEVRQFLEESYGRSGLYQEGLKVATTMDLELQRAAERALRDGLLALDKRQGWRGGLKNVLDSAAATSTEEFEDPSWSETLAPGTNVTAIVSDVEPRRARLRHGRWSLSLDLSGAAWTRRRALTQLLRAGDLALVRVVSVDAPTLSASVSLEQEPKVEGSLIAIDNRTGQIKAMVGGYDFHRSKFNRAVQARRQTGSAFKPLVYASAFESGFTPADTLFDEPIKIEDPHTGEVYEPRNYTRDFYGLTTLRIALEKSRNPITVQLLQKVGPYTIIDTARRLGITAPLQPYPSLALGAFEATLVEVTTSYTVFANLGVLRRPYFITRIEDRDGNLLHKTSPVAKQVMDEDSAFLTSSVLQGVVERGTAKKARTLGRPLAGKTGTTDDFTDAWFMGYSPSLTCGVWIGFDQKRSIGNREVGAVAALPIWMDFMEAAHVDIAPEPFVKPAGVELVRIDRQTGRLASEICGDTIMEAFVRGTAPITYCIKADHDLLALPYFLQKEYLRTGTLVDVAPEY